MEKIYVVSLQVCQRSIPITALATFSTYEKAKAFFDSKVREYHDQRETNHEYFPKVVTESEICFEASNVGEYKTQHFAYNIVACVMDESEMIQYV